MDETILEVVRQHCQGVKVPGAYDKVYKDECMFSFDNPEAEGGLYVNLTTLHGFGADSVLLDHERTGNVLYLHLKWTRVAKAVEESAGEEPTKLGIGVEGGFGAGEGATYEHIKSHALVVYPAELRVELPCPELPERVIMAIDAIMAHTGASTQQEVAAVEWQEEKRPSKYAKDLPQEQTGKRVPPDASKWRCDETGAEGNLWLNLSDGHMGQGRPQWDGSGGNGSALRHYQELKAQGKVYPLVVKLGTITPDGADVYSYAEDEDTEVEDPYLAQHLAHWGIDVMKMSKTEKSMTELQIEINKSFEFDRITESGENLKPLSGPGLVGLQNLGNSCYINSVVQILKELPEVRQKYLEAKASICRSAPANPEDDFAVQFSKLLDGLLSQRYVTPLGVPAIEEALQIRPWMFKALVGKGHAEFRTGRQQDASEYFQHLLEVLTRSERAASDRLPSGPSTAHFFEFTLEERIQCAESRQVRYKTQAGHNVLALPVPMEHAINKEEVSAFAEREQKRQKLKEEGALAYISMQGDAVEGDAAAAPASDAASSKEEEKPVAVVPFDVCLAKCFAEEQIGGFFSSALGRKGEAIKRVRVKTFPRYLVIKMERYYVSENWTPKKLDVLVEAPEHLSLEHLRGAGITPEETPLPEEPEDAPMTDAAPAAPEPSAEIVTQLVSMGFGENGCKRAAVATNNSGAEAAMNWVLEHMGDADFNDPYPPPEAAAAATADAGAGAAVDPEALMTLQSFGFSEAHARAALGATHGSVERAADWLFSHADDLDAAAASVAPAPAGAASAPAPAAEPDDGRGEYELLGFVSHMGSNTACGHYVCHIKKEGRWVIFNDQKVAESLAPPKDLGYMYVYKRLS